MATRLASLNDVKSILRISTAETSLDTILGGKLETVSQECESYCGRVFAKQTVTDELYDGGGDALCVKNFPVDLSQDFIVKTSGFYATIESGFYTTVTLIETQFTVNAAAGILSLEAGLRFPTTKNSVSLSYTGGYAVTGDLAAPGATTKVNVPASLSESVARLTAKRYLEQQASLTLKELTEEERYARTKWFPYVRTF